MPCRQLPAWQCRAGWCSRGPGGWGVGSACPGCCAPGCRGCRESGRAGTRWDPRRPCTRTAGTWVSQQHTHLEEDRCSTQVSWVAKSVLLCKTKINPKILTQGKDFQQCMERQRERWSMQIPSSLHASLCVLEAPSPGIYTLSSIRDANKSCSCLICLDIPGKRHILGAMFN